jgi:hypothetical protein
MGPPGHLAVAFVAKPAAPKLPLWLLLLATEFLDLLAFGFMAIGLERGAPNPQLAWSHGLFMSVVWSAIAGGITFVFSQDRKISMILGLVVFSHWVLDFVSHSPDLPILFNGSPLVGLGIENSLIVGLIIEFSFLAVGVAIYFIPKKKKTNPPQSI